MKIKLIQLRKTIQKVISEVYKLSPADEQVRDEYAKHENLGPNILRALGLQSEDDIRKERKVLQAYQQQLQSSLKGKRIIKKCVNGEYLILHGVGYEGTTMMMLRKGNDTLEIGNWLRKYGNKGNDALSCVLFPSSPNSDIANWNKKQGNAETVVEWLSLIIKGYPVFLSWSDAMTQTLGAIPQGLKDHQKNSGIAKRPASHSQGLFDIHDKVVDEALIDNWQVVGIYLNAEFVNSEIVLALSIEALENNLPVHLYDGSKFIGKFYNIQEIESYVV